MDLYDLFLQHPVITTDSRSCPDGSLFFALKGERFNANAFAANALESGCRYAIIDDKSYAVDERFIVVDDVLKSLQNLATQHRKAMPAKIIGITGSNGKTTTKELIASVLKERYEVLYTRGNLNNHIGVPLTLLQLRPQHQLAIIEMGANHPGEIAQLSAIAQPDFGIITNVGKAHLEGFGSFEGVKRTKGELYQHIAANGLGVFINAANEHLQGMAEQTGVEDEKRIYYQLGNNDDPAMVTGKITANDPFLRMECNTGECFEQATQLIGAYNAENVLAAVTIGQFFGLKNSEIKHGIESYTPSNNRSQLTKTDNNQIIADAYNANPSSMQAAIENLLAIEGKAKAVILGDMLELGDDSEKEHQAIISMLNEKKIDKVYLVGNEFKAISSPYPCFSTTSELQEHLQQHPIINHLILIKGSRGIQLENVIPFV
jgi:UDP-N-acetylmuramoyl-tripeptide--D-alanyl-D-alanine ligase